MQLILLLGAGVSVPSGLPTAPELTDRLFHDAYHDDGAGNFSPGPDPDPQHGASDITRRVRELLRLLRIHDNDDIQRVGLAPRSGGFSSSGAIYRGTSTYEDLFFLCQQIGLWNIGLSDNSLTTPFMESIERKAQALLRGPSFERRLCDLATLGDQASFFIESVVADALRQKYLAGLDLVGELAATPTIDKLHIVTLNHDTLLEQYLSSNGLEFIDGFGEPDGDVRWSDDCVYDAPSPRVRVIKLHGSVNWYSFLHAGRAWTAIPLRADLAPAKDADGKLLTTWRGVYGDMHFRFNEVLRRCERMIMSGYGWGDTAISFQLDT
jgi:hypothetical protein